MLQRNECHVVFLLPTRAGELLQPGQQVLHQLLRVAVVALQFGFQARVASRVCPPRRSRSDGQQTNGPPGAHRLSIECLEVPVSAPEPARRGISPQRAEPRPIVVGAGPAGAFGLGALPHWVHDIAVAAGHGGGGAVVDLSRMARIERIDAGEMVAVYGDYDADGVTATAFSPGITLAWVCHLRRTSPGHSARPCPSAHQEMVKKGLICPVSP